LLHLLPIIHPPSGPSTAGKLIDKVTSDFDFFIPFRQHAPSLKNARREIYADLSRLACDDGVGFFNILAFRGVFFGSPFAQSNRFRWFESFEDWKQFKAKGKEEALKIRPKEEEYYVKKNCYGRSQKDRSLNLLSDYWKKRRSWNETFNETTTPTLEEVFNWLISKDRKLNVSKFYNIGSLTALLICGDLIEAGIMAMPSSYELGRLIYKLGKGAKDGMQLFNLVGEGANEEDFCNAFASLDAHIEGRLGVEEKNAMGYNVVMLEHTLCKMKRLTTHKVSVNDILSEIL
jgi:hypothetical protein